jgi:hypothetical protein
MSDPVQDFLRANGLAASRFGADSRYAGVGISQWTGPQGVTVNYLQRRFIAAPQAFPDWQTHRVVAGDRLDNLAARYFGNPGLYWRICDANRALRPQALTEALGSHLRITLAADAPGGGGA